MPDQLSFAAFDDRPRTGNDRLLFLTYVEPKAATRAAVIADDMRRAHGLRGAPLAQERLHITLQHFADFAGVPPKIVDAGLKVGESLVLPSFDVTFDQAMSFHSKDNLPFVLCGDEVNLAALIAFQKALGLAMAQSSLKRFVSWTFKPHVTLLYDEKKILPQPVEPVTWTVREFALVHSVLGQTRHITLGRWALRD